MNRIAKLAGVLALMALSLNAQGVRMAFRGEGQTFEFMSAGMAMEGAVVKGAPYSADATNESVQTLADGNRIVRRTTTKLYRDSEGRTRREQTLEAIGPWSASGQAKQIIMINDPVAGVSYTLDPSTKTARKLQAMKWSTSSSGEVSVGAIGSAAGGFAGTGVGGASVMIRSRVSSGDSSNVKKEDLGGRSFEGIPATGNRITLTIPAGQMGNERPIEVVTENWYSSELQVTVSTSTRDPRMGDASYRLSNINRADQPRFLFEVPADYTLQQEVKALRIKKEM